MLRRNSRNVFYYSTATFFRCSTCAVASSSNYFPISQRFRSGKTSWRNSRTRFYYSAATFFRLVEIRLKVHLQERKTFRRKKVRLILTLKFKGMFLRVISNVRIAHARHGKQCISMESFLLSKCTL